MLAKAEVDERARGLGREAAAPRVDAEPVAELGAAIAREPAQLTRCRGARRDVAARDRERDAAALRPTTRCGALIQRAASATGYGVGTAIR